MYCPKCEFKNDDDAKFCKSCGTALTDLTSNENDSDIALETVSTNKEKDGSLTEIVRLNKQKIAIVSVLVILVVILIAILLGVFVIYPKYVTYPNEIANNLKTALNNGDGKEALAIYEEYYVNIDEKLSSHSPAGITARKVSFTFDEYCNNLMSSILGKDDFEFNSGNYWAELCDYLESRTGTVFITDEKDDSFLKYYYVEFDRYDFDSNDVIPDRDDTEDERSLYFDKMSENGQHTHDEVSYIYDSITSKANYFYAKALYDRSYNEIDNTWDNVHDDWKSFAYAIRVGEGDCYYEDAQKILCS